MKKVLIILATVLVVFACNGQTPKNKHTETTIPKTITEKEAIEAFKKQKHCFEIKGYKIFFLLMTFLLSFCKADTPKSDRKIPIKDKVIEIIFSENIILKWEVYNNRFEKDDFYQKIKENSKNLIFLKKSISDTTNLGIRICSKEKLLRKGDIAFLYLQDIGKIPLYRCLKIQFDVFEQRCPFPEGLLDYVENNREIVKNEIIKCY